MVNIEIDNGSGFCFGVTTAIQKAEEELAKGNTLYCLGDIVHNGMECERLRHMGLTAINHDECAKLRDVRVLLRAHGEPPETYAMAKANNIEIIDATCPVVLSIQKRIKQEYDTPAIQPKQIIIYGQKGHAEVLGLVGQTDGTAIVIESIKEIDNWVAAIEMADSLGLHIVSTSLGYTTFDDEATNWSYADMDGKTSRGAQAAVIAARKGMLLVVAMGNDGAKVWHYLSTPADADSILSVGAVNREGTIAKFSSYGPSADGRVKPEVCALGEGTTLLDVNNGNVFPGNGTSFACPLIAGMAACLWSALPEASKLSIRVLMFRYADRNTTPQ